MSDIKWRIRWFVLYFPLQAWRRVTDCRVRHAAPYDGGPCCMHCGAPWFADA